MSDLENFISRGMKAQKSVDEAIAKANSPAPTGASPSPTSAGEVLADRKHRPRSSAADSQHALEQIRVSQDAEWLHSVATDADLLMTIRDAASRRFRVLTLAAKRKKAK